MNQAIVPRLSDFEETRRTIKLLTMEELQLAAESATWLVHGYLPSDSLGVMFGGSQSFKSFIAIDLALHVAHGKPWLGKRTKQGHVVIIVGEGAGGIWKRIEAWHREHGIDWHDAPVRVITQSVDLAEEACVVSEAIGETGIEPRLIIVDTLSQTFAGEENSATEVAGYLREIGGLLKMRWQCCVLVIHHTGHDATERPRGSSAIKNNTDFLIGVFRDADQMLATACCLKQKDAEAFEDISFALSVFDLGIDKDGEQITSLVARAVTSTSEVLDLMETEKKRGRGGNAKMLIDIAENGSHEKELRQAFYEKCGIEHQDAKRQAYFRARGWAVKAGILEIVDGRVIVISKVSGINQNRDMT